MKSFIKVLIVVMSLSVVVVAADCDTVIESCPSVEVPFLPADLCDEPCDPIAD